MTIKEEIRGIGYEKLPTVGLLAPKMMDFLLAMKEMGFSINATRIVLILSANLKEKQMKLRMKDKHKQLDIFDNEWLDVDNDKAMAVQFNFRFSDFLPKGSKNYKMVKEGLDELQEKSYLIEFEKAGENGKIKKYHLKSALISSYLMEEGNGFKMIINNFWYRTLIDVSYSFNSYIKPIIFNLNQGSMSFYLYLKRLDFIKVKDSSLYQELFDELGIKVHQAKGTRIKKETFREKFGLTGKAYQYDSDLKRKVLDVWRNELNKIADLSFGYRIDDKYIYIVTYEPTKNLVDNKLIGLVESTIKQALNYKVKNKNLQPSEAIMLLEVYLKYTYEIVFKATERKSALRGLQGQEYLDKFIELIEVYIKKNRVSINEIAYPNVREMRENLRKSYRNKGII